MLTLRRGRKDKAKGISLYTDTILDDVERENAANSPPTSPTSTNPPFISPLSPTPSHDGPQRQTPPVPPKRLTTNNNLPKSRLGQSAEIQVRHPNEGALKESPRTSPRPMAPELSNLNPGLQSAPLRGTGVDSTLTDVDENLPEDKDAYLKERDDAIMKLRDGLKKVCSVGKKYNSEATKHVRGMNAVTESIERLAINDKKSNPDSVYVEALLKFVEIDKALAESTAKYHQHLNDITLHQINNFVEEDIQHELKNLKAKYDKARREYESACAKVTNLRAKKNLDILKLYAAEKEAIKAKARYHASLDAALVKVEDVELKKQTDLMEWILKYVAVQREGHGECYAMLHHVEAYLQDLTKWAGEWRATFAENTFERNQEQQNKVVEEDQSLHLPLLELAKNDDLIAVMKKVAAAEGVSMPPLDSVQTHWTALHSFLRSNYDPISQALLTGGKKQLLIEVSSALGLLEKANEVIDMAV